MKVYLHFHFMMNVHEHNAVTDRIIHLFEEKQLPYRLVEHPECHTSEESFAARKASSGEEVTGAKALLVKCYPKGGDPYMAMVVLAGPATLSESAFREHLGLKKIRFASPEEIDELTALVRGCIPPFGAEVFPAIAALYLDAPLLQESRIGFNAASLCRSLIVDTADYAQVLRATDVFDLHGPQHT